MRLKALMLILLTMQSVLAFDYGLHINSYPEDYSRFTAMELNSGKALSTSSKPYSIQFFILLREENPLGQVMMLKGDGDARINLVFTMQPNDEHYPALLIGDEIYLVKKNITYNKWLKAAISIDPAKATATFEYDGAKIDISNPDIARMANPQVGFGTATFNTFQAKDLASVDLKDLTVSVGGKLKYNWRLARNADSICYDKVSHTPATVCNGRWLVDNGRKWSLLYRHHFPSMVSTAFNPFNSTFFFTGDGSSIYSFDAVNLKTDSIVAASGNAACIAPNQLVYLPDRLQLMSFNLNDNSYSAFDFNSNSWQPTVQPLNDHYFWHNSNNYDEPSSRLYSFGGYGHYQVNNTLIITDFNDHTQQRIPIEGIKPKRMHSAAIVGDKLYVFGGQGNTSGKQEMHFRNDYSLYAIDLQDFTAEKIWEMPKTDCDDFTFAENMVYNPEKNTFYALGNFNRCALIEIDPTADEVRVLSEPIDGKLSDQYTYINLFLSPKDGRFYAVVSTSGINNATDLAVYALDYPAMTRSEWELALTEIDDSDQTGSKSAWALTAVITVAALMLIGFTVANAIRRHRAASKAAATGAVAGDANTTADSANAATGSTYATTSSANAVADTVNSVSDTTIRSAEEDYRRSCIRFLGGFRVYDANGEDITANFTPVLRSLLILLIVKTANDPKGVSSNSMIQLLWGDKTDESAKNNRNVNLSKLRTLLERVGDVTIVSENRSFWKIRFGKESRCDYVDALNLFKTNHSGEELDRLLSILLLGVMLPNCDDEWLDNYKSKFSDITIDFLSNLLRSNLGDDIKLKIADTLLRHDYLSELAIETKCRILCRQGKNGLAKTIFDTFCRDYRSSLGVPYPRTFPDLITP